MHGSPTEPSEREPPYGNKKEMVSVTCYIINTSPRPQANCKAIAQRIADQVPDSKIIDFKGSKINYCQACNACMAKDEAWCVQGDDWASLIPELDACDGVVLLSPIYFGDITAQAKTVIDRLYAWFNPAKENMTVAKKFGKKIAVITTNGGGPKEVAEQKAEAAAGAFNVAGFTDSRVLSLVGLNAPESVLANEDYLAQIDEVAAWLKA